MMYNLFGALVFLVIGIIDVMFMQRMVYPQMRRRHEAAKVTGSQGRDPALWRGIRVVFHRVHREGAGRY